MILGNVAFVLRSGVLFLAMGIMAACSSSSTKTTGSVKAYSPPKVKVAGKLTVCSGYGCLIKDRFSLSRSQQIRLKRIVRAGRKSAGAERRAIAKAISSMEVMARGKLGYQRDSRKSANKHNGKRGQMDCVDESLNTTTYLTYLHSKGWLKYHKPRRAYAARGAVFDGRYPHKSAVMIEKNGTKWAVDSWYGNDGDKPKIMTLKKWRSES